MVLDTLRRSASARRLPLCVSHYSRPLLRDSKGIRLNFDHLHRVAESRFVSLIMSARPSSD